MNFVGKPFCLFGQTIDSVHASAIRSALQGMPAAGNELKASDRRENLGALGRSITVQDPLHASSGIALPVVPLKSIYYHSPLPFLSTSSGPMGMMVHRKNMNMCTYLLYR